MAKSLYTAKRSKIRPQGKSKISSALLLNALKGTTPSRTTAEAGYKEANRVAKGLLGVYLRNEEQKAADRQKKAVGEAYKAYVQGGTQVPTAAMGQDVDATMTANPDAFGDPVHYPNQTAWEGVYGTQRPELPPNQPQPLREDGLESSYTGGPPPVPPQLPSGEPVIPPSAGPWFQQKDPNRESNLMLALQQAGRGDEAQTMLFENMRRRNAITDKTDPRILDFDVEKARRVAEAEEKAKSRYSSGAKTSPNYNSAVQLNKIDPSKSVAEWIDVLRGDPTKRKVAATNIIKNPQAVYSINRYLERKLGKKPNPKQTYKYVLDMIEGKESAPEAPAPAPGDAKAAKATDFSGKIPTGTLQMYQAGDPSRKKRILEIIAETPGLGQEAADWLKNKYKGTP